tara:strand:- start:509 stop:814 length:306 start_codon:yes stop_codon:yes gene_type:complete
MPTTNEHYELSRIDSPDVAGTIYAAVDHASEVVWGIGNTHAQAMTDANYWMRNKPCFQVTTLDVVPMKLQNREDYDADGETLYRLCIIKPEPADPVQGTLI